VTPAFRLQLRAFHDPIDVVSDTTPLPDAPVPAEAAGIDHKEALRAFRQAARLEPTDPDYYYILGLGFARAERHAEAAAAFQEAVALNRLDAEYRFAHGAALWELGHDQAAADAFHESLHLRPGDAQALNGLACAYTRLGREQEAVALFEEALRTAGPRADLYGNLAVALWNRERTPEALRAFRKAVSLEPASFLFRSNLGLALAAARQHKEAATTFRHAVIKQPDNAAAHYDLAESLHAAGHLDEAERALERGVRIDPSLLASRPESQAIRAASLGRKLREDLRPHETRAGWLGRLLAHLPTPGMPRWNLSTSFFALFVLVLLYLGYRLVPPHVSRFLFADDVASIAGAPIREDADIADRLRHAVQARGLESYVDDSACDIQTKPKWRRIVCRYRVPVEMLPGRALVLRFHIDVERPYLTPPETIQISPPAL
jgi:Flp pilus assembly protein TadD